MEHTIRNSGITSASILSLLAGRSCCPDSDREGRQRGVDCRPVRPQKGRRITRPGRPFSEVLALPSYIRSFGALSALGIRRNCPEQQDITAKRLGADPEPPQGGVEYPVCRRRRRLRV